jgi:hypothetical protein
MYSVYECDADGLPVDNLDKIPVEGPCRFVQKHESFWGKGEDYESAEIESPTWLEVCILAHRMILVTGDLHHVFLEGVSVLREEDGVKIVEFEMGS